MSDINKAKEPEVVYEKEQSKKTAVPNIDFEKEFANGLTSEEFLSEIKNRIRKYPWKK